MTSAFLDPWSAPANWTRRRFKYFGSFSGGGTPAKDRPEYWSGTIPWVSPKDMKTPTIRDTEDHISTTAVAESATRLVSPGALLMVVRSGILQHSIPTAVNATEVALNQDMRAFRPATECSPRFVHYLVEGHQQLLLTMWRKEGATVESLEAQLVENTILALPDTRTQETIAAFLDRKTAAIDQLIEKKERLIALLQEKRQALITQAVTKGLDPSVPMKDSGLAWIGSIPSHWSAVRLRRLAIVHGGVTKGRELSGPTLHLPYLRVANVQDGAVDLADVALIEVAPGEVERFSLRKGDILMNEGGDNDKLGRGAVWEGQIEPCLHQNHVFAVRPRAGVNPYWVALATQSAYLKFYFQSRAVQSTNLASISASNIKQAPIVLPPSDVIESILIAVGTALGQMDALATKVRQHVSALREYRQALISAAVTGQIDMMKEVA